MVSWFSFVDMRSSSGLLRKSRRNVVQLAHNLRKELVSKFGNLEKKISCANEKGTRDSFIELLDVFYSMESEIHIVIKEEVLISYRVENREINSEASLKNTFTGFFNILEEDSKRALSNSVKNFNQTRDIIKDGFTHIRTETRNIRFQKYDYNLQAFTTLSNDVLLAEAERILPSERSASKREKSIESDIQKSLDLIHKIFLEYKKDSEELNKDPKKIEKLKEGLTKKSKRILILVSSLEKNTKSLKDTIETEMNILKKVCKDLYVIRVRLIHMLSNKVNPSIKYIRAQGIDENIYNEIASKYIHIYKRMHRHALIEEKMALHEYRVDSRADKVTSGDVKKGNKVKPLNNSDPPGYVNGKLRNPRKK
jgi:hypothetical protein